MEIIKIALNSLKTNKLRSGLTILGIVIGIFSIISITTVISVLQENLKNAFSQLGPNTFQIQKWPRVRSGGSPEEWAKIRNRKEITLSDFYELEEMLNGARFVGAERWNFGKVFKYESEETNPNTSIAGVTPGAFPTNDWNIEFGRAINEQDVQSSRRVCVLGSDVANKLFEFTNPIGKEVKVDGYKLKVIGVLESEGAIFGMSRGNYVLSPITTFQGMYGKRRRSINITVMAYNEATYQPLIEQAEGIMRKIRKVPPGEDNDFDIWSNESVMTQINDITAGVRIGAFVIAGIALLAAGIGIMNIMLVSVTERTKEIGIRKAIGAKRSNILTQFLTEAVVLCQVGGIIGIVLGVSVGNFLGSLLEATPKIPMDWVGFGVFICVLIGVVFGTYPAYKAANLDPIESLRYE